jgi:hypothetical protein
MMHTLDPRHRVSFTFYPGYSTRMYYHDVHKHCIVTDYKYSQPSIGQFTKITGTQHSGPTDLQREKLPNQAYFRRKSRMWP